MRKQDRKDYMLPGELSMAIDQCKTVLVLVDLDGFGRWFMTTKLEARGLHSSIARNNTAIPARRIGSELFIG